MSALNSNPQSGSSGSSNISNEAAITYIGTIRRSEGNVLIIFSSLTLGLLVVGSFLFVLLCRTRRLPPQRYGLVRRCTTSALCAVGDEAEMR